MGIAGDSFIQRLSAQSALNRSSVARGKRHANRVCQQNPIVVLPVSRQTGRPAPRILGQLRNLSLRGVGLLLRAPLKVGDPFVLQVLRRRKIDASIHCTVVYCKPDVDGLFSVGARIHSDAADSETDLANITRIRQSILD